MRHASLFTGIGAADLAAEWMGWENMFMVEIDADSQKVLRKNFPQTPIFSDIKLFDGTKWTGRVDILTGGFPCQPFSDAGSKKGKTDDRYLWPEMLRVAREIKPAVIVPENVNGIRNLVEQICVDLENEGYTVEPINLTSSSLGFDNMRSRYWFVAYSRSVGREYLHHNIGAFQTKINHTERTWKANAGRFEAANELAALGDTFLRFQQEFGESPIFGVDDGIPKRLDIATRLKQCGNSMNPHVVYEIFKAIEQTLI